MPSRRRSQAIHGAAVAAVALAALVTCDPGALTSPFARNETARPLAETVALQAPAGAAVTASPGSREVVAATAPPAPAPAPSAPRRGAATSAPTVSRKTVATAPPAPAPKRKKKLRADVDPEDFVISNVSVSETGYKARIEGYVRMTRKGALAQPLMRFDLKDGNGDAIHTGTFTPMDASGPAWIGYDELGLKRVPFETTVDLRADGGVLPAVPPRPYSASVRVAEVIDAKPAKSR